MQLSHHLALLASDQTASSAGAGTRCEAANFRWEPAVSNGRATEYNTYVGDTVMHGDWQVEHKGYLSTFVQVPKDLPRSPECFMAVNQQAHLAEALDNTFLLRLESIDYLFANSLVAAQAEQFWLRFFKSPKDLLKPNLSDAGDLLRAEFVRQWNEQRIQARPLFATFLNDFGGNLDALAKDDWPHILRDRLGLMHLPKPDAKEIPKINCREPVALMCYTVKDVRQARQAATKKGAVASLARPTVLDAEMSAAFIPAPWVPGGGSFGHTLDLGSSVIPADFTPELLTYPLDYQPHHIKALGFITRPHALQSDDAVLAARNRHVQGLQALPDCADFGEVLT